MILTIVMIVLFFGVMIGVGINSRRHATDVNGFVLGGRTVGPWLTAFAFGTSYFSAVIFIGYAGQFGWRYGVSATWAGLGNAFIGSLLAWVILGRRTRIMTQRFDSKTMPDFFGKRFDSDALRIVASAIVFIFLIPYTASLYNGLSSLFNISFNIPYWVIIVVMAALTCVYVIVGGYMATAINDFIQGIIMLVGIVAVIVAVLNVNGGFVESLNALSQIPAEGTVKAAEGSQGVFASFFGPDPLALLFVVILTSLGTWGLPQMVGKFYAIKNEESIKKGTIISTIFAIIVAGGCYFLGGFGRLFDSEAIHNGDKIVYDKIVPAMLSALDGTGFGKVIIGIVIVLVLAASMSTLSSLVLTSSSTLTLDLIDRKGKLGEKKKLLVMRLFVLFFVIVSAVIAIVKDANPTFTFIAQMMGVSWGALAGSFLAPFLYGLYWKKATKASVWASFVWGVGVTIVQLLQMFGVFTADKSTVFGYIFSSSINSGVVAMLGGLVIVPLVSLFTRKPDSAMVEDAFAGYDKKVEAAQKHSLD
ncbi:MAG: sodium:solute symporter [Clostridia bacterium]|nr:sodium:solute symporter [Clostridia bacterium]